MPADGATPNFALVLPEVGASADSWGTKTNANWTTVDADMHNISVAQGNYLPLTGGTLYGGLTVGGLGIAYSSIGGHGFSFGWDGLVNLYVDNNYEGDIATTAWVSSSYKPIGAYTPNQNVDVGSGPSFSNVMNTGGIFYVANSYNYYMGRGSDGYWRFVENGAVTFQVSPGGAVQAGSLGSNGGITAAGQISAGNNGFVVPGFDPNAYAFSWNGTELIQFINGVQAHHLIRSVQGTYTALFEIALNGNTGNMVGWAVGGAIFTIPVNWVSDRALKSNIRDTTTDALAALNAIPVFAADVRSVFDGAPVQHWDWTVMADDVGQQIPAALIEPDGADVKYASLREGPIIATLIRAVQQLSARVEALEARA